MIVIVPRLDPVREEEPSNLLRCCEGHLSRADILWQSMEKPLLPLSRGYRSRWAHLATRPGPARGRTIDLGVGPLPARSSWSRPARRPTLLANRLSES